MLQVAELEALQDQFGKLAQECSLAQAGLAEFKAKYQEERKTRRALHEHLQARSCLGRTAPCCKPPSKPH